MATDLTLSEFRTAFPEFAKAPDALVQSRLEFARQSTDVTVWGDNRSIGIGFYAAHLIAMGPGGFDMRLEVSKKEPTTIYSIEYKNWQKIVVGGATVAASARLRAQALLLTR